MIEEKQQQSEGGSMSSKIKEMLRTSREALNILAAIAAIVALPIYIWEAPARSKAAKLEDLQFALLCADVRSYVASKRQQAKETRRSIGQPLGMFMNPEGAIAEIYTAWANDKCEGVLPMVRPK